LRFITKVYILTVLVGEQAIAETAKAGPVEPDPVSTGGGN